MRDEGGPDWVREALRQARDEVRSFLRTAWEFSVRPVTFARQWLSGERHALNPLGFLATAFAVVTAVDALALHVTHGSEEQASLTTQALASLLPFAYYLLLGVLQHGVLRLFGSRRPLRDSCAMALYAGGGPATAVHILMRLIGVARELTGAGTSSLGHALVVAGVVGSFTLFCTNMGFALGALHHAFGIRFHHVVLANVVALVVSGLAFGLFDPPGHYGLHFVLQPGHDKAGWHVRSDLED